MAADLLKELARINAGIRSGSAKPWVFARRAEVYRGLGAIDRGWQDMQRYLETAPDFDALPKASAKREDAWLFALQGVAFRKKLLFGEADAAFEQALRLDGDFAWAWGWWGENRLRQGMPIDASFAFKEARLRAERWPELHRWLGELNAHWGRPVEAKKAYDRALDLGDRSKELFLLRSDVHGALGDARAQRADLAAAVRLDPDFFEARLKEDRVTGADADFVRERLRIRRLTAKSLLDAAIELDPEDSALLIQRCKRRKAAGDLDGATQDMDRALAVSGAACEVLEAQIRIGLGSVTVDETPAVIELLSRRPSAQAHLHLAERLVIVRSFPLAFREFDAAIAADPGHAAAYHDRARARLIAGEPEKALVDLDAALQFGADALETGMMRIRALTQAGRFPAAERERKALLKKGLLPEAGQALLGQMEVLRRRLPEAERAFDRAGQLARNLADAVRLARHVAESRSRHSRGGKAWLIGIGSEPSDSLSVESAAALMGCDVVYRNLHDSAPREFVEVFCPDVRAVTFRYQQDIARVLDTVFADVRAGRRVAFLTYGHPLVFGPLGKEFMVRAQAERLPHQVLPGYSTISRIRALAPEAAPGSGLQVLVPRDELVAHFKRLDPTQPAQVYFTDTRMHVWRERFFARLVESYPAGHQAFLFHPENLGDASRAVRLQDLPSMPDGAFHQQILYIPPA